MNKAKQYGYLASPKNKNCEGTLVRQHGKIGDFCVRSHRRSGDHGRPSRAPSLIESLFLD